MNVDLMSSELGPGVEVILLSVSDPSIATAG